jgi:hypothetical protein
MSGGMFWWDLEKPIQNGEYMATMVKTEQKTNLRELNFLY